MIGNFKKIIVCAMDESGLIGVDNTLPWKDKEEMEMFKGITLGKIVVMGRNTYESIGSRPLKNRVNIVLSRCPYFKFKNESREASVEKRINDRENAALVTDSLLDVFAWSNNDLMWPPGKEKVMCFIGGSCVYRVALEISDEMRISTMDGSYVGSSLGVYFPFKESGICHDMSVDKNSRWILDKEMRFENFTHRKYVR